VLEHIPWAEGRSRSLAELARVMKPEARLVVTVYNWHEGRKAKGVPKEGVHPSGVFFHCFEPAEFREQLLHFFDVDTIWGGKVVLPGTHRLTRLFGGWNRYWDRLWWRRPESLRYGEILIARCFAKGRRGAPRDAVGLTQHS
jgi:SAM-dependent methyltransferase